MESILKKILILFQSNQPLILYFVLINTIAFILFKIDKHKAMLKQFRISEKSLFIVAILGGTLGSLFGMFLGKRHKTTKWYFTIGIPAILLIQVALIFVLFKQFK